MTDLSELQNRFYNQFKEELKTKHLRQKVLIIHLAIEFWINKILTYKLNNPVVSEFTSHLNFHKRYTLAKDLGLLNADNLYDDSIDQNVLKKLKRSMRDKGKAVLQEIKAKEEGNPINPGKEGEFSFLYIDGEGTLQNNIVIINQLRNLYAHNFFIDTDELKQKADSLQPVFNSDKWLTDYKDKIEFIGANTVFLLLDLYIQYRGHLIIVLDEDQGIVREYKGSGKFIFAYHFKKPSVWAEIKGINIKAKTFKRIE